MDIKPNFYDEFHCIADQCSMTCCMQWKIAVDEETVSKWKGTSLDGKKLDASVRKNGREGIIKLDKRGYCPYLKEGLCRFVTTFGEDMLSETCHTFPREIHEFDELLDLYEKEEITPADIAEYNRPDNQGEIYFAIQDITIAEEDRLKENNELWLDIAYNYRKEGLYTDYIEEVSRLAEDILENNTDMHMDAFKKELSAYEPLFRKYLVSEIFTNMLIPDLDLEAMVVLL